MKLREAKALVGVRVTYSCREVAGLRFACLIRAARSVFGRTEFQVAPVQGEGLAWVQEDSVEVPPKGSPWRKASV